MCLQRLWSICLLPGVAVVVMQTEAEAEALEVFFRAILASYRQPLTQ